MVSRRHLLPRLSCGYGMAAFAGLAQGRGLVAMAVQRTKFNQNDTGVHGHVLKPIPA